ncbi:sugar ABC transporter permease [Pengzhenrongella sicca]|uniref:Sugar ABC transporter permease n=1 Tax=Pengzhenrongella sicca TaxID=2819238 RepID=A0A8A4ZCF5_9MICO|nr:sugar ABC transporter permease [Pengzhenrongella sicca]
MASSRARPADPTVRSGLAGPTAPPDRRRAAVPLRRRLTPYGFLLPAFCLYAAFLLVPIGRAVQLSLYEWDGLTVGTFVGLDNFATVASDPRLREAFWHALVLIIFYSVLPLLIGLLLAAVLNRGKVRGLPFFRTVIFLPQVVAMVVVAVAWRQIYAPNGSLNSGLRAVGLGSLARPWLGDYTFSLPAVGFVGTWVSMGLVTVLLLAGMSRIPIDLFEAARLDGAGAVREFFAITLPAIRGEITVALTLTIIAALKTFDLVYVTTGGGPGTSTTVPSYEVYRRAFQLGEVGAAAAVGITLTILIFGINLVVNKVGDRSST